LLDGGATDWVLGKLEIVTVDGTDSLEDADGLSCDLWADTISGK
jgi:hypothetical protein